MRFANAFVILRGAIAELPRICVFCVSGMYRLSYNKQPINLTTVKDKTKRKHSIPLTGKWFRCCDR